MTQISLDIIKPPQPAPKAGQSVPPAEKPFAERLASASQEQHRAAEPHAPERPAEKNDSEPANEETTVNLSDEQEVEQESHQALEEPSSNEAGVEEVAVADVQDQLLLSEEVTTPREISAPPQGMAREDSAENEQTPVPESPTNQISDADHNADHGGTQARKPSTPDVVATAEAAPIPTDDIAAQADSDAEASNLDGTKGQAKATVAATHANPAPAAATAAAREQSSNPSRAAQTNTAAAPIESQRGEFDDEEHAAEEGDKKNPVQSRAEAGTPVKKAHIESPLQADEPSNEKPLESKPELQASPSSEGKPDQARPEPPRSIERVAERLTAARSAESTPPSHEERVDAARFVGRVSRAMEAAHQRGDVVRLRLSPPELGAMQIKLSVSSEGAMHASVETETAAARNVLLDNLPVLRERLAGMEIRVEKFDVNVGHQGGGQQDWRAGEDPGDQASRDGDAGREAAPLEQPAAATTPVNTSPAGQLGPDQINLVA